MAAVLNVLGMHNGNVPPEADVIGGEIEFNHPDDRNFWCSVNPPCYDCSPKLKDSKAFVNIKRQLKAEFTQVRNIDRIIEFIKKCFKIENEDLPVNIRSFIRQTNWFGSLTKVNDTCTFLTLAERLMNFTTSQEMLRSPFSGNISQEQSELFLQNKPIGTYLIRLSEGMADRGGFALAVKANAKDVRHYRILGDPVQAAQNPANYNARLKLVHEEYRNLNHMENEYATIVDFLNGRLQSAIEDNIYCEYVCPNLPFDDFR